MPPPHPGHCPVTTHSRLWFAGLVAGIRGVGLELGGDVVGEEGAGIASSPLWNVQGPGPHNPQTPLGEQVDERGVAVPHLIGAGG